MEREKEKKKKIQYHQRNFPDSLEGEGKKKMKALPSCMQ